MSYKVSLIILCLFALFTLVACSEERSALQPAEPATLCITLGTPQASVTTRSVSDDPDNSDGKWTDDEKLIDGRYLKELVVLLVDGTALVEKQIFTYTNTTTVTQEVAYKNVVAGKTYRLIALANYSLVSGLSTAITNFAAGSNISSLYNYKLDAGDDFVAPKQMQPLTWVQDVTIPVAGGTYEVSGELIRTYARLRIEVENKSGSNELTVNSLNFNTDFAQKEAYLFTNPDDTERNFTGITKGKPSLTSTDALTTFAATTTIATQKSKVIFDGYILESRNSDEGYIYTLDVEYKGATTEEFVTYTDVNSLNTEEYDYFLIQNIKSGNFMYAGDSYVMQKEGVLDNLSDNEDVIWRLDTYNQATDSYNLYNINKRVYLGTASSNQLLPVSSVSSSFQTLTNGTGGIRIDLNNNNLYLNDYQGAGQYICIWWDPGDNGSVFRFYPIDKTTMDIVVKSPQYNTPIILSAIDNTTGVAADVTQISRNDFINVLVNVAYNETTGTMEFYVRDWEKVSGEITFD